MAEIRTARFEDWEGNVYLFGGSGDGQGGVNNSASDIVKDKDSHTDGALTDDPNSNNGSSITINAGAGSTVQNIATVSFSDLPFGFYSVNLRVKSSVITSATNLILVSTYFTKSGSADVKLSQTWIKGNMFNTANAYQDFSLITEFKGTFDKNMKLKVVADILPQTTATTLRLDNIVVNRAYSSFTGIDTTLY